MPDPDDDLELHFRLDEGLAARSHVERWSITVTSDGAEIGDARVLVLNLAPGMEIGDLVDRAAGTWIDVETADASRPDSHVLVLDRVWVHPDHRGHGLGPRIATAAIERLRRGCHVAACFPAPFECDAESDDDRQRSIEALGAIWSKVGFRHWRDGVWMLELV